MHSWQIVTGEYPPQIGGVSDYTRLVARGLADAGDRVRVWAPACPGPDPTDRGVEIRRISGLVQLWREVPRSAKILVQYVPHAFGWKAMNVPFCVWLWSRRHNPVWVMFHEVAMPIRRGQPLSYNVLGMVNRWMASIVARSAERIWIAIPAWEPMLRKIVPHLPPVGWLPVPSGIPVIDDPPGIATVRAAYRCPILLGHFGAYGAAIATMLNAQLPGIMRDIPDVAVLLIGRGSERFARDLIAAHPEFTDRIHSTGTQAPEDVSRHISACDAMLQPYPDGVSSRRTSIIAALAHGRPVLTNGGPWTEPLWHNTRAVMLRGNLQELLADRAARGAAASALYESQFALRHTIEALRLCA